MEKPRVQTNLEPFVTTVREASTDSGTVRVPVEVTVQVADPFEAYRRAREGPGGFYLETTGGQDGWGYFGVDPAWRLQVGAEATRFAPDGSGAEASAERDPSRTDRRSAAAGSPSLAELDAVLAEETLLRGDCDVPYPCGAVGWLSYDVARELESIPDGTKRQRDLPRLQLGVFDAVAAWEEPRPEDGPTTLQVTACPVVADDPEAAYRRGRERACALARAATAGEPATPSPPVPDAAATFESECGRAAFRERVRRVKDRIRDGDTFQANVSHRLSAPAAVHPVEAFRALREVNPAPYSGLLEFPGVDLVSASPELLLRRSGRHVETEPIAGTRPRGPTGEADERLAADLLADEKERAEHAMLVDLERNDLGAVSEYGTVTVPEYRRIDRYSEVMHLVSLVEGRLREGTTTGDAVAAVFPGGTITGAPKPRTMEIIESVERSRRGPYTGSIGLFGFDGRATLNITIRTLVRHADRYTLRVGAGIVHDSRPDEEYEETLDKARALVTAFDEALGDSAEFALRDG